MGLIKPNIVFTKYVNIFGPKPTFLASEHLLRLAQCFEFDMPALREHEHFFLLLWGQLRTPALGLINCFENPSLGGESPSIVDEYPEYSDEKVYYRCSELQDTMSH